MKKSFIIFTAFVITVCAKAQTVITSKGTKLSIDTSKWTISGSDIYNKNAGKIGIGTISPGSKLDVKGTLRLSGSTSGYVGFSPAAAAGSTTYILPNADGSNGQALTTNGSGTLSWAIPSTTVSNTSSANNLSTTVNGTTGSNVSIINSNVLSSSTNTLTSTVNGVASSGVNIINSNTLGLSGNTLTSTVNGVSATSSAVGSVSNTSSANNLSTTVNGVAGSNVSIINSNATSLSGANLTTTVNGVAATALDLSPAITSKAWSLSGNGGTTAGTNYIGTSDAVDLVIKTSGAEVIRALSSGKVGIGTSSPNQKLEVRGTNAQPTGMNASTTNATFRVSGNTNHALDFGTFTNSPYGSYIESQNLTSGSTLPLVLNPSGGYVGIGVTNPDAPLQINASTMSTSSLTRSYFNVGSGTGGFTSSASTSSGIQVHANGYFWADGGGYVATSDARIKNIIGLSNTAEDLAKLTKIQVTDYTYIDKVNNTSVPQKKVIAQQLKSIYPIAVNQNTGIIPNVFETAATTKVDGNTTIISTTKAHAFKTGDMVKLIIEETGEKILEATVIDEHTFTVAQAITAKVFVYGKKVNDLLNVDYDAVAMLNVSATQELAKQLKQSQNKIEQLQAENNQAKKDNAELKKMMADMQAQLSLINKKLGVKK